MQDTGTSNHLGRKVQASVQKDNSLRVSSIFTHVCKTIGLQETSWPFFTLVEGATKPVRRLKCSENISLPYPELCLRKWTFDVSQEKVLFKDPVAMEMLFKHANYDIRTGTLCPDEATNQVLEDCLEPSFQVFAPYVLACHGIAGYHNICFRDCVTQGQYHLNLPAKSVIDLYISTRGLHYITANQRRENRIPWGSIKRWSHSTNHTTLTFDLVQLGSESSLQVRTTQTRFMLSVILDIITTLQKQEKREDTIYFASDIHRHGDRVVWDNLFYDPGTENPVFVHSPTTPEQQKFFVT